MTVFKILRAPNETGPQYLDRLTVYVTQGIDEPQYSITTVRTRIRETLGWLTESLHRDWAAAILHDDRDAVCAPSQEVQMISWENTETGSYGQVSSEVKR